MPTRKFCVNAIIEIEVDQRVLDDVLTDEWRSNFYPLTTPEDVAGHLAFNLVRGAEMHQLDGFADQPRARSPRLGDVNLEIDEVDEVKTTKKTESGANEKYPDLWMALAPLEKYPGGQSIRRRTYNILTGPQADARIKSPAELKQRSLRSLQMIKQLGRRSLHAMAAAGLLSDEATAVLLP